MSAFKKILNLNPQDYNYHIYNINTQLNHISVLDTTITYILFTEEQLHHTVTSYSRIRQPESLVKWVRNQIDDVEDGKITNPQYFMNQASLKLNNIHYTDTCFQDYSQTTNDVIVAIIYEKNQKHKPSTNLSTSDDSDPYTKKYVKIPLVTRNFNQTSDLDSTKYKADDRNIWHGVTYYFCGCPTYKDRLKCHTHIAETCHTRKRCMESKHDTGNSPLDSKSPAQENLANNSNIFIETSGSATTTSDNASALTEVSDINYLLEADLSQLGENQIAQYLISDALNAIN